MTLNLKRKSRINLIPLLPNPHQHTDELIQVTLNFLSVPAFLSECILNYHSAFFSDKSYYLSPGPNTPAHERHGGPGVGVRLLPPLHMRVTPPQSTHLPAAGRGEASKCDKLASLFSSEDIDLGVYWNSRNLELKYVCYNSAVLNLLNFHFIFIKRITCLSDELRKVCWSGIPRKYRPIAWKTLSVSDQNIVMLLHKNTFLSFTQAIVKMDYLYFRVISHLM